MSDPKPESASNTITVPVDELIKARDGVVTGLTTLTSAINELIRAYIQNTNEILRDAGVPSGSIAPHTLFEVSMNSLFASGGPDFKLGKKGTLVLGGKVKKERKARDPNAPKRPLTAFFLYSASARPIVKQDLPETASSQEVSNEVLRRWNEMPAPEKEGWKKTYEENASKYREEVAAYKARVGAAAAVDDEDVDPAVAIAGVDDSEEEDEIAAVKPAAAPAAAPAKGAGAKPKGPAKKKGAAAAAAAAPPPASPSPSAQLHFGSGSTPAKQTPVPLPGAESTGKKGDNKRKKDADDEEGAKKAKKPRKDKKDTAAATAAATAADDKKKEKEKKEKKEKKPKKPKESS